MIFFQAKGNKKAFHISIQFNQPLLNDDPEYEIFNAIENKLAQYFDYQKGVESWLRIGYDGVDGYVDFSLATIKKPKKVVQAKRIMPTRAATKRKYV